jgi:hypothetical protein
MLWAALRFVRGSAQPSEAPGEPWRRSKRRDDHDDDDRGEDRMVIAPSFLEASQEA